MTDATITPTAEQKQRAEWDLLLRDLELRSEQVRQMKSPTGIDIDLKLEQLRQMKPYQGWRLVIQAISAAAAVFIAGAAVGGILVHALTQ